MLEYGPYINGRWIKGEGRANELVINPATEEPVAQLWHASDGDLDSALNAAAASFDGWRRTSSYERAKLLRSTAQIVRERQEDIAQTLTQEQGKILQEARGEVGAAVDIIEWAADEGRRAYGRIIPARAAGQQQLVFVEPVGPVAAFTPWNFPATTPARKIATALAAGCPIIIKAAEETPGTCAAIVQAFHQAGLPAGVLNLVFGQPSHISQRLLTSPVIRKLSFTGSVPVGKHLMGLAANNMQRLTMELGGHSPAIVFADADPVAAAKTLVAGKYRNAGQVCTAPSRFYVHRAIAREFLDSFVDEARKLYLGNGLDPQVTMGPLANRRRLDAISALVTDAVQSGELLLGGEHRPGKGFFFEPTVIHNPDAHSRLMLEEPFGPVAPIVPFDDFDEVIARANSLPYGLAAYVFSSSLKTSLAAVHALESGMVAVNGLSMALTETPMGGVKDSGQGYEGGIEGLSGYLQKKYVSLS